MARLCERRWDFRRAKPRFAILCLGIGIFLLWLISACDERSVGQVQNDGSIDSFSSDGSTDGAQPDVSIDPDGASPCHAEPLAMGFVGHFAVSPTHPDTNIDQYEVSGLLIYQGPITEPFTNNPAFDREVQIQDDEGQISIVQYFLPLEMELPVEEGKSYIFTYREKTVFEYTGVGLIIERPTSGLTPLLFVGDAGFYAMRVFAAEDPLMSPLKVYRESRPDCPPEPMQQCEGSFQYWERLNFDSSTGGQQTEVWVNETAYTVLPIFGDDFWVVNLASNHHEPSCGPDDFG